MKYEGDRIIAMINVHRIFYFTEFYFYDMASTWTRLIGLKKYPYRAMNSRIFVAGGISYYFYFG
ncbi:MAG: hypothetical protein IT223_04340 [Crocinitomicaceae bacterium]|nr:hypothetical protein [Crocinitomicaceae bacterium]